MKLINQKGAKQYHHLIRSERQVTFQATNKTNQFPLSLNSVYSDIV